jgi:hypothetical protein
LQDQSVEPVVGEGVGGAAGQEPPTEQAETPEEAISSPQVPSPQEKLEQVSEPAAPAAPAPQPPQSAEPVLVEEGSENFGKVEIQTLLVPVRPLYRLIAVVIVITCYSVILHMFLNPPPSVNALGMHRVTLSEAGSYLLFFKGKIDDPYGWSKDGRFRMSLDIELEPLEPGQKVDKIEPIRDISGANVFSVAEYEVNQPGQYSLWVKWNKQDRCEGRIYLEKDPVEKFFLKWALGIAGTIAFFYSLGIPLSTRQSQAGLPATGKNS